VILRDERCNDDFVTFCPYFIRWLHSNSRYPCNDTRKHLTLTWQIITAKVIYTLMWGFRARHRTRCIICKFALALLLGDLNISCLHRYITYVTICAD